MRAGFLGDKPVLARIEERILIDGELRIFINSLCVDLGGLSTATAGGAAQMLAQCAVWVGIQHDVSSSRVRSLLKCCVELAYSAWKVFRFRMSRRIRLYSNSEVIPGLKGIVDQMRGCACQEARDRFLLRGNLRGLDEVFDFCENLAVLECAVEKQEPL